MTFHQSDRPSFIGAQWRIESPAPGSSTLITSAPKSASWVAASGPAIIVPASITRRPFSGPCKGASGPVDAGLACAFIVFVLVWNSEKKASLDDALELMAFPEALQERLQTRRLGIAEELCRRSLLEDGAVGHK